MLRASPLLPAATSLVVPSYTHPAHSRQVRAVVGVVGGVLEARLAKEGQDETQGDEEEEHAEVADDQEMGALPDVFRYGSRWTK